MEKTSAKRWGKLGGAVAASVALHLAVLAVFLVKPPDLLPQPQPEETVTVELVPPPEENKPEEQAKAEEPPPPKEEKAEEAKAEEPPAPAEPPPPSQGEGQPVPLPVLRPVFEFGEKDSGPKQDMSGNASQEAAKPPPETQPQQEETKPSQTAAEKPSASDEQPGSPLPDGVKLPEVAMANPGAPEEGAAGAGSSSETSVELSQVKPPSEPATQSAEVAEARPPSDLEEVRTLFSRSVTDDPFAMTAMAGLSRSERADQLCLTELREQLRHEAPRYRPVLLPSFTLEQGTVLDIREAAFRTSSQWYELSFRCEVDEEVVKVVSFAFHVGDPIPESEWERRGFPAF
ncbi:MAG: DUF930 domain-containing protein [Rhizobium sp.]